MKCDYIKIKLPSNKVIIIGSFVLAIIALSVYLYNQPTPENKKVDLRQSAIFASHKFIKEKLRKPGNVIFQPVDSAEYYYEKSWYDTYHYVISYFDAETVDGKIKRAHYTMELQKTQTVWLLIDLDIR